jgi:hypothetical protein
MEKTVLYKGRFANGWKGSKVSEKASLMKTTWPVQPLHGWQTMLSELMLWFKRTDRLLSSI